MTQALTKEQQKIVEDNHNLIYGYAYKHNLDLDEYYDLLAIALCRAAMYYDGTKCKFTTYVYNCMCREVNNYKTYSKAKCRCVESNIVSLDVDVKTKDDKNNGSFEMYCLPSNLIDVLPEDYVIQKIIYEQIMLLLSNKEKQIFKYKEQGLSEKEIANRFEYSQQNINYFVQKIKQKWFLFCN